MCLRREEGEREREGGKERKRINAILSLVLVVYRIAGNFWQALSMVKWHPDGISKIKLGDS